MSIDRKSTKKTFKTKCIESASVMLLPVLLYLFMGPLSVYQANSQGFDFQYEDFFFVFLELAIIILPIATVVLSVVPNKIRRFLLTIVFYLGIASYLQDMFFNIKLSESDGSSMKWDELRDYTRINTIVWIAIFLVIIFFFILSLKKKPKNKLLYYIKKYYDRALVIISGYIDAVVLISSITLLVQSVIISINNSGNNNYALTGKDQYKLASKENIIVFVVDSYGTAQLDDGLKNNPGLLDPLKDFTYYDNADCSYFGTFPSMTHMLTGVDVDYSLSEPDYLDKAWSDENAIEFYNIIHDKGYKSYLYSTGGSEVYGNLAKLNGLFENADKVEREVEKGTVFLRMAKISIYKYMPYILKPKFEVPTYLFYNLASYKDMEYAACGNFVYNEGLQERGIVIDEKKDKAFIIQHIDGTHLPHDTGSDGMKKFDATLQETQEGIMFIIGDYITRLKKLGLYDDATIIITADHGRFDVFEKGDDPQVVYFIKRKNETGDKITINSAPISHDDFRATILNIIGLEKEEYEKYGTSIYDHFPLEERERILVNREIDPSYPDTPGEACNVYVEYKYTGDRTTICEKAAKGQSDASYQIIGW